MKGLLRHRSAWLAIGVAFVLRVFVAVATAWDHVPPAGDPVQYLSLGRSIAAGDGYLLPWCCGTAHDSPPAPTAMRQPAYPLFLAAVFSIAGDRLRAVLLAQAALDTITCVLLGATAALLFGSGAGLFALVWASLYPELWIHVTRFWSEGLFVALTAALFYTLACDERGERRSIPAIPAVPLIAGALLGLLVLTRPNGIFFAPVVAFCVGRRQALRRRLAVILIAMLSAAAVIAPWAARNFLHFHRPLALSTGAGFMLAGANNDKVLEDPDWRGAWTPSEVVPLSLESRDEFEANERLTEKAMRWAASHWTDLPRLAGYRVAGMWWRHGWNRWDVIALDRWPRLVWVETIGYGVTLALAAAGLWSARRRIAEAAPFLPLTIVSFTVSCCLSWGDWRFRAPVEPALVVLAAAAFASTRAANVERARRAIDD